MVDPIKTYYPSAVRRAQNRGAAGGRRHIVRKVALPHSMPGPVVWTTNAERLVVVRIYRIQHPAAHMPHTHMCSCSVYVGQCSDSIFAYVGNMPYMRQECAK